jgi:Zn-finger protein
MSETQSRYERMGRWLERVQNGWDIMDCVNELVKKEEEIDRLLAKIYKMKHEPTLRDFSRDFLAK